MLKKYNQSASIHIYDMVKGDEYEFFTSCTVVIYIDLSFEANKALAKF